MNDIINSSIWSHAAGILPCYTSSHYKCKITKQYPIIVVCNFNNTSKVTFQSRENHCFLGYKLIYQLCDIKCSYWFDLYSCVHFSELLWHITLMCAFATISLMRCICVWINWARRLVCNFIDKLDAAHRVFFVTQQVFCARDATGYCLLLWIVTDLCCNGYEVN